MTEKSSDKTFKPEFQNIGLRCSSWEFRSIKSLTGCQENIPGLPIGGVYKGCKGIIGGECLYLSIVARYAQGLALKLKKDDN